MKAFPIFLLVLLGVALALVCHGAQGAEAEAKDSSNTGSLIDGE